MKATMKNDTAHKLTVSGLRVDWFSRPSSFYVEAFRDGVCVLAVEWTPEGSGEVTTDDLDDATSSAVFEAVRRAYTSNSARN